MTSVDRNLKPLISWSNMLYI